MKISKLFHWLYGFLMMMPIFAVGVTCLVNVFKESKEVDIIYKYQTNDVNTESDLIVGNIYHLDMILDNSFDENIIFKTIEIINIRQDNINSTHIVNQNNTLLQVVKVANSNSIRIRNDSNGLRTLDYAIPDNNLVCDFVYNGIYNLNVANISECENIPIETIEQINKNNIFYYAIDKVKDDNLFKWASDSFLSEPFKYITNLFGMPNDSVVILLLSYWLDISLIWLVFDLVMYMPLLVHRWLDKGVLE